MASVWKLPPAKEGSQCQTVRLSRFPCIVITAIQGAFTACHCPQHDLIRCSPKGLVDFRQPPGAITNWTPTSGCLVENRHKQYSELPSNY